ncbi:MAG: hypothetical protein ACXWG0_08205 [Chthoniobacterales bacterium]
MSNLDRLLRAASAAKSDSTPEEAPFGFETRVVANWHAQRSGNGNGSREFARFFKRVAAVAIVITACASAGAFWQLQQNDEIDEATGGAYAMTDSAIEANTLQ